MSCCIQGACTLKPISRWSGILMNNGEKLKVVETILERAATKIGDITNTVMEEFYRTEPELQSHPTLHVLLAAVVPLP